MKKKAFTLTELLVVVVIIGTLAAVVLPKFTRVIETRRTTEAENIMRAVRNEQNARCTLDKPYTTNGADLAAFPKHEGSNTNYTYALSNTGISATRSDGSYTLRIPAYDSGQICCEGGACNSLNKGYPGCRGITDGSGCAAEGGGGEPPVVPPVVCSEGDNEPVEFINCTREKWRRCESNAWVYYEKEVTSSDCRRNCGKPEDKKRDCPGGKEGTQTMRYTCNETTGAWEEGEWIGECPSECQPNHEGKEKYTEQCPGSTVDENLVITYTWDFTKCKYLKDSSECSCYPTTGGKEEYSVECPNSEQKVTYKWDWVQCKYSSTGECPSCETPSRECNDAQSRGERVRWDRSKCACVCDDNGAEWDGQGCVTCKGSQKLQEDCEQPTSGRYAKGVWVVQAGDCKCLCPRNSSYSTPYRGCQEDFGAGGDVRECEDMGYPGDICDPLGEDPYDPIDPRDPWWDDRDDDRDY